MLNPVALAIITTVFAEPRERAKALGVWGAVFGVSLALGPVLGRALTETFGWRAVFLVNGSIGIVAIALVLCFVPEAKAREIRSVDKLGQVLFFLTITALSFGFIEDGTLPSFWLHSSLRPACSWSLPGMKVGITNQWSSSTTSAACPSAELPLQPD